MHRRAVLHSFVGVATLASGCLGAGGTGTERATGEIDVAFRTEASRNYDITFRLVDVDGRVEEEFESEFPPDQTQGPSFYAAGLTNGPYTATVTTESDSTTFEWSPADCSRLDVLVTVRADGRLAVDESCADA